jgi:hypothetical protein
MFQDNYNSLDTLKEWEENKELEKFINILNDNNIILDEENTFNLASRIFLENWNEECTNFIIDNGYENSEANFYCLAFEVKERGFVYSLFDLTKIEPGMAKKYVLNYKYNRF